MNESLDYKDRGLGQGEETDRMPLVSVVVATYNRTDCLLTALDSLLRQDYGAFEIIVIDQSEEISERKQQYWEEHPDIRVHHLDRPNRCYAKNSGVRIAKGEIVLICDDDIVAPSDLIACHAAHYDDPQVGGGSCRIIENGQPECDTKYLLKLTCYGRLVNNAHSTRSAKRVGTVNGGNMSFRRELLADADIWFEERFIGTGILEEQDLSWRVRKAGYRLFFDASTTVQHVPQKSGNLMTLEKRRADWHHDYFFNLAIFWRKHGEYLRLLASIPYVIAAATIQTVRHRLPLSEFARMIGGYWSGIRYNLDTVSQDAS